MTLDVWLARPAGGKTQFCLKQIHQLLAGQNLKKVWVLVPDQRQAAAFRNQLIKQGGGLGVHVGSFDDVCKEIVFNQNSYIPLLTPALRHRLLREVIRENEEIGSLKVFSPIAALPGFQSVLQRVFIEFCQAGVPVDAADQFANEDETSQIHELLMLYRSYSAILKRIKWMDPEGLITYTQLVLRQTQQLLWQLPDLLVMDGFDRFTAPQINLIKMLEKHECRMIITQTAEPIAERMVNQRFVRSLNQIKEIVPETNIHWISRESFLPPELNHISQHMLNEQPQPLQKIDAVRLLVLQSPLEEVREVLRWVKHKIVCEGCFLSELAVIIPDELVYPPLLHAVAREFGIKLIFSRPAFLSSHPAVKILMSIFLLSSDLPRRDLLDVVRSPYLDLSCYGLSKQDAAALDLVSRYGLVMSGLENWQQVLTRLGSAETAAIHEDEFEYTESLPTGENALRLRDGLTQLADDLKPLQAEMPVSDWVVWLVDLLRKIEWQEKLEQGEEEGVLKSFAAVLDGFRLGEFVLDTWILDYPQFLSVLQGAFEAAVYSNPEEKNREAVPILRMIEARGVRFKHIAIMGMAEGSFPQVIHADPFLPDNLREKLGLELRLDQERASEFYLAFTRADHSVLLTRPYLTSTGEALEASPYWNAILEIVGKDQAVKLKPGEQRDLSTAASLQELAFWAWSQQEGLSAGERFGPLNQCLVRQRHVLDVRLSMVNKDEYEGQLKELPENLQPLVSGDAVWSPSRLETYITCPFQFWVQTVLNLKEQHIPEAGLQASQLGSMLHQIMEEVYPAAEDPFDPNSVAAALPQAAQRVFELAPQRYGFTPDTLWAVEQAEWLVVLETAVHKLAEDGWQPLAHEQKFGIAGFPPLTIRLDNGKTLQVRGLIDRVDRHVDGSLRVVDYKTGSSHQDKKYLLNGRRLQLPLYAWAVEQVLGYGDPREGFYWALLAKKAGSLKLSKFSEGDLNGPAGARAVVIEHLNQLIQSLTQGNFQPKTPEGGCPAYCPAHFWCWHFKPEGRA